MTRIAAVRTALPIHRHHQAELAQMTAELCGIEPARRPLLDRLFAHAGVETRHTVLPLAQYAKLDDLGQTNDLYIEHATDLADIIGRHLATAVHTFLAEHTLTPGDIQSWVCHPGGPNVIDA